MDFRFDFGPVPVHTWTSDMMSGAPCAVRSGVYWGLTNRNGDPNFISLGVLKMWCSPKYSQITIFEGKKCGETAINYSDPIFRQSQIGGYSAVYIRSDLRSDFRLHKKIVNCETKCWNNYFENTRYCNLDKA